MRLTKRDLGALALIAPKSTKGGGAPSVRVGSSAEATDGRILLRLRVEEPGDPGARISTRTVRDAARLIDPEETCELRNDDGVVSVRMQDGSRLAGGVLDHAFPKTESIKRLRESEIGAAVFLDAKLLRKVAAACVRAANVAGTSIVRLEVPVDESRPIRFAWSGGEAFLMPMTVEDGRQFTPDVVEVPFCADGSDVVDTSTGEVTEAAPAPSAPVEAAAAESKSRRRAARAKGGAA